MRVTCICDQLSGDEFLTVLHLAQDISEIQTTVMAEELDGEEFVVDKILDKRTRNGKIEYYLSWKVSDQSEHSSEYFDEL